MKLRVLAYCLLAGIPMLLGAMGMGHWVSWWLSGFVLALAFVPVALYGPRGMFGQFRVIAPALFVITALLTWSEAVIFVPQMQNKGQMLVGSSVTYLIFAIVLAVLAKVLKLNRVSAEEKNYRGFAGATGMVLLCGVAYLLYYFVFGAITYQYFTKGYYPEATKIVEKLGLWFWGIQFARGVLMTLAVLPIIYTLRMRRWQAAIVVGGVIWIAGGLAPLLIPNPLMTSTQRMIHVGEIFTQNFSLGLTAALLLRKRESRTGSSLAAAA